MEALWISTGIVALAEMGDKTQLLALLLAARFRKPIPIIWGILIATLLNHGLAGALGSWLVQVVSPNTLRWALGLSFLGMAAWMLIPDKIDEAQTRESLPQLGVFAATFVAFFLAEMGDKTQIATVALSANYSASMMATLAVIAGTTIGMMIANVPAVLVGHRFAARIPMKLVHGIAAAIFAVLGVVTLMRWV